MPSHVSKKLYRTIGALAFLAAFAAIAIAQDPLPLKPPPVPTGVIPLPQGPPPTTRQAAVPKPAKPLPKSDSPLAWSPDPAAVNGYAAKMPLTLENAVSLALYTNRMFAMSVAQLQQAKARTGQARAQLSPTLGLNADLTYFDAATTADFGAIIPPSATGGKAIPPFVIVPQFNPVYTAAFSLPIDVSGTLRAASSQAQFNEVAARIDVNRVRNQVVYDVKTAFYNVLRAQAQLGVATDNLNNALFRLSDANKNYAAGTNSRFDVLTAQRDVSDAQQALITNKSQVSVNLAALKNTMGIDISTRIRVSSQGAVETPPDVLPPTVGPVTPNGQVEAPPSFLKPLVAQDGATQISPLTPPSTDIVDDNFDFGPEYKSLLKEALTNRPEVLEAQAQITAAQRGIQYARRSSLPSVSVGLQYVDTPNATGFSRVHQGIATLNLSVPLYDGGLGRERVREAEAVTAEAEINRRTASDQVQVDVQQAYIALVQARQRVAVSNVEISQAREAFRVSRVRYASGVSQQTGISPQVELSNAQSTLAQAQSNQVNALYDYNNARAQLDRALGRYAFVGSQPGYPSRPEPSTTGQRIVK